MALETNAKFMLLENVSNLISQKMTQADCALTSFLQFFYWQLVDLLRPSVIVAGVLWPAAPPDHAGVQAGVARHCRRGL